VESSLVAHLFCIASALPSRFVTHHDLTQLQIGFSVVQGCTGRTPLNAAVVQGTPAPGYVRPRNGTVCVDEQICAASTIDVTSSLLIAAALMIAAIAKQ
jgi:hypothetical protein